MDKRIDRRQFVGGAACAAAAAAGVAGGAAAALAGEAATQTYADTIAWDAQYDVVVLGMGFAGMVSAVNAAKAGASVLICEKAPEGEAGGNSRVCGQGWADGHGDVEGSIAYYKGLANGCDIPDEIIETIGEGVASMGGRIASYGLPEEEFDDTYSRINSPEYPEIAGDIYVSMVFSHQGANDAYLYNHMRDIIAGELSGSIDVWYETPGLELVQEPELKTVIGVRVDCKGEPRNVRALNGVCVCTGGFECNPAMVQHYLNINHYGWTGGSYNTGDGIKMAAAAGARLWHMHVYEGTFGMLSLGWPAGDAVFNPNARMQRPGDQSELNTGATIVVGDLGRRYGDESYCCRHGHNPTGNGIWENPRFPDHSWIIWDKTQMDAIEAAEKFLEDYRSQLVECATVEDVAAATGCDAEVLAQTIADYNGFAEAGYDPQFGRDPATMRPFDGEAYFVLPLLPSVLNTQGGPERNAQGQILGQDGEPIPHLYGAGECGNSTVCMYQSGSNVAECFIMGERAGAGAAAPKDPLPAYSGAAVASAPALVGAESDL